MEFYTLDPMHDSRWDDLAATHPGSSVFHTKGWLSSLAKTYGYTPIALTSTPPGEPLLDGIAFCEIKSWITGSRLVSLPFADHSDPLLNENSSLLELAEWMRTEFPRRGWKYIELRPLSWGAPSNSPLLPADAFWFHTLDLTPSLNQIFSDFHKSSIQRRILRAERERLCCERGCSEALLSDFYRLLMITRRRHGLLPQPRAWFRNLIAFMSPDVELLVAKKDDTPIAAILTLRHRRTVVYKYGCSNESFHHLGGMPFLFWKLIEEAKAAGGEQIDFGRTDLENSGLVRFKDQFGTVRKRLTYLRYPDVSKQGFRPVRDMAGARRVFSFLPDTLSSMVGGLLYRHVG